MTQARDGGGHFTQHLGAAGHLHGYPLNTRIDLKGNPVAPQVIAKQDCIVHDNDLQIDRQIIAGQPVPPDLLDAYAEKTGEKLEEEQNPPVAKAPAKSKPE